MELLDFSDYDGENQFSLFEKLCEKFNGADGCLYWLPLSNEKESIFDDYDPVMIAKTPLDTKYLKTASASFMQMLNGGLMIVDSKKRFIAIVVDGYYIVAGVKRGGMDKDYIQYIENWKIIGERLDPVTANILLEK